MKIKILKGKDRGKIIKFPNSGEFFIGRDKNCEISINDTKSSRRHARIFSEADKIILEDLNSTNGTVVNGQTVFKNVLNENDEIFIGDTVLLISDISESAGGSSTSIRIKDEGSSTVIVSTIPHHEADILMSNTSSAEINDLILENKVLRKICEISQIIVTEDDSQKMLISVLDILQEVFQADSACILIWSENESDWITKAVAGNMLNADAVTVSRTIIQQALSEGVAILTTNPMTDSRFDPSISIISAGISSALCSPLKIGDKFLGVLFFDRRNREEVFSKMDLRMTATAANILGLFLENEKFEEEARKRERLAVIGEVIAGLAHCTKNIITGLKFSINALEVAVQKNQPESIPKFLKAISSQERRISDLVLNMLSYSKERIPSPSRVDLKKLIEDVFEPYYEHMNNKKIKYEINYDPETPVVFVEESSFQRVLLNLLVNAIDSFKIKENASDKFIRATISPIKDSNEVLIKFFDTGCGISPGKLEKIFNIFFSTKGSEGTGLGLAVVKKIVEEHEGGISVDSKENEWTEFSIRLPVKKPDGKRI